MCVFSGRGLHWAMRDQASKCASDAASTPTVCLAHKLQLWAPHSIRCIANPPLAPTSVLPPCSKHLCIGGIFIRLLLEAPQAKAGTAGAGQKSVVERLPAPKEFFAAAHHRLLCLGDASLLGSPTAGLGGAAAAASGSSYGWAAPSGIAGAAGVLRGDAEGDRELCVRAMAAAYNVHAGLIGPVEGIPHLVSLLDATPSRALRQHLLLLLEALVSPSCLAASAGTATSADGTVAALVPPPPAGQEAAARAAHANAVALLEAGGVQLMVDLVTGGLAGRLVCALMQRGNAA